MIYLVKGNWPEGQPEQDASAEQEPTPLIIIRVDRPGGGGPHQVRDGHDHPAGLNVLRIHGGGHPAAIMWKRQERKEGVWEWKQQVF